MNIFKTVQDTIKLGKKQRNKIKRINAYINDKYYQREDDDAIFWNLSNSRIIHFAKLLALDTKDFIPYGIGEYNMAQAWTLRKIVGKWFDDSKFYRVLNDVAENIATYGSSIWKKTIEKGEPTIEHVNLENVYFDPKAESIADTNLVELHELSRNEVKEKEEVWKNVDKLLALDEYKIWEFRGMIEDDGQMIKKHIIGYGDGDDGFILWEETLKDDEDLYYDFTLGDYKGSWLRVGIVERLFKLQERVNQLVNQNAASTEIASLLLFRTGNQDAVGNVLEQTINGQIISSDDLQQIGISNTGLNSFISELQLIENKADALCLTPQILQGESTPSTTTFRGLALMQAGIKSAFTAYHQNLGEKIADILMKEIFPQVIKKYKKVKFIEIAEDDEDIESYDNAMLEEMKKDYLLSGAGKIITPEVEQELQSKIDKEIQKIGRKIIINNDWINLKWGIKVMPTDETIDKGVMNDAYMNALQLVLSNPQILDLPLFKQYLENNGINWHKLTAKQKQSLQQINQQRQPVQPQAEAPMNATGKIDKQLIQALS